MAHLSATSQTVEQLAPHSPAQIANSNWLVQGRLTHRARKLALATASQLRPSLDAAQFLWTKPCARDPQSLLTQNDTSSALHISHAPTDAIRLTPNGEHALVLSD